MSVEFRELRTAAELAPLPALEKRVWGGDDSVAVNMLVATVNEGGMAIGAFDGDRLVGSVFGFATLDPQLLHSHYLAVDPDYRGQGLGVALKRRQRDWCLANGRTAMRWTYDPLQLGNAHMNLRSLGAIGVDYHIDLYGRMGGINGGLASDRIVVHWQLVGELPTIAETADVVVPDVSAEDIAASNEAAQAARHLLRAGLQPMIADGWKVIDIDKRQRRYTVGREG